MADDDAKRHPRKKGRDQRQTRGRKPGGAARASVNKRPASVPEDLVEATHEVVEEEVREGEATTVPDPDQKHERGSSV